MTATEYTIEITISLEQNSELNLIELASASPAAVQQHSAIARNECSLDSFPPTSVARFGGRQA